MNYFRSNKTPQSPDKIVDDFTEKLINYDNQTVYDMVSRVVKIANSHIFTNSRDDSLDSSSKNKLENANEILNPNTSISSMPNQGVSSNSGSIYAGGKRVKRKSKTKKNKRRKM